MTARRVSSAYLLVLLLSSLFVTVSSVTVPTRAHATTVTVNQLNLLPDTGPPGTWVTATATLNMSLSSPATCSFTASHPYFMSSAAQSCTVIGNSVIGAFKVRGREEIDVSHQLPGLAYQVSLTVSKTGVAFLAANSTAFTITPRIGFSLSSTASQPWPSSLIAMSTQIVYVHGWGYNASSTTCTYKASPGPFSSIATASSCSINAGEVSGQFTLIGGVGTTQTIFVNGTTTPATEYATGSLSIVAGPAIQLTPNTGAPGTSASITGIGFTTSDSDTCAVSYKPPTGGGALYTSTPICTMTTVGTPPTAWRQPSATFTVAPTATKGLAYYVNVTGSTGDNAWATFTPYGSANITLSPSSGTAGQLVTITTPAPNTNRFSLLDVGLCTISPAGLFSFSNCFINATGQIPALFTSFVVSSTAAGGVYAVTVTGSRGDYSNPASFTVGPKLTLSPTSGSPPAGTVTAATEVTATGAGFRGPGTGCTITATAAGLNIDTTGEPACAVTSAGVLTAKFKVGAGSLWKSTGYTVNVTGPLLDWATASFNVNATIAFSPTSGSVGTLVNVFGSGFNSSAGSCEVGGTPVSSPSCTQASDGTVVGTFTVKSGVSSGSYIITVNNTKGRPPSAFRTFVVGPGPIVTFTPSFGTPGQTVIVSGSGWNTLDTSVRLRNVTGGIDLWDLPEDRTCAVSGGNILPGCTFTVRPNARGGLHTVNATGTQFDSSVAQFLVQTSFTISPTGGPVGTFVAMSGSGYLGNSSDCTSAITSYPPLFASSPALKCRIVNHVLLGNFTVALFSPDVTYGPHTVTITNATGVQQGSISATFTVNRPTISVSPSSGPRGRSVTVTGSYFGLNDTGCKISSSPVGLLSTTYASSCAISGGTVSGSFTVNGTTATVGVWIVIVNGTRGATFIDSATTSFTVEPSVSLSPASGRPPTNVLIFGSNFASADTGCTISASPSTPVLISNPQCLVAGGAMSGSFTVASGASGSYTVIVTGTTGDAGKATFTVPPSPTLTLSPNTGPVGTAVSASGSNYAGSTCLLTAVPGTLFTSQSCTISGGTLTGGFTVGSGAALGSYTVTVQTNAGATDSATATFTVKVGPAPTLTLSPTSGAAGTVVTASGTNYVGTTCTLSSVPSGLFTSSSCSITAGTLTGGFTVATGASAVGYTVTVTTDIPETRSATFTVTAPVGPTLTLSPTSGVVGTAVTASGSNYAGTTCTLSSSPSGLMSSPACSISAGALTGGFTVASGAATGSYIVTVTTNVAADTKTATFTVTAGPPVPTFALSPTSGAAGTAVAASGSNYVGTTCTLSASPGGLFTSSSCSISGGTLSGGFTVASGASAGSYTVTVATNAAGEAKTATFTVTPSPPTFTLSPASGRAGTAVAASGSNYVGTTCTLSASPGGLFTSSSCSISAGALTGGFTVASAASTGSYTVTVTTNVAGETKSVTFTVTTPRPCIIATATFGSEVSWAVQFLRSFRDGLVLSTRAGSAFMDVFNAWYYSFSPSVAGFIASNDPLRAPVRVILYPLLGILGISAFTYSIFSWAPEFAIVMAGLVASSLIGLVYLTLPAFVGMRELVKRRRIRITSLAKVSLTLLAVALALLAAGELTGSFLLLAAASSAVVLICLVSAPAIAALALLRLNTE